MSKLYSEEQVKKLLAKQRHNCQMEENNGTHYVIDAKEPELPKPEIDFKEQAILFAMYIRIMPIPVSDEEDNDWEEMMFYSHEFDEWLKLQLR